jgi:hypothetical protein
MNAPMKGAAFGPSLSPSRPHLRLWRDGTLPVPGRLPDSPFPGRAALDAIRGVYDSRRAGGARHRISTISHSLPCGRIVTV